jgi:hypothetical protein
VRFAPSVDKKKEEDDGEGSGEEGEDEAARIARKREKALRKKNKRVQKCVYVCMYVNYVVDCLRGGWWYCCWGLWWVVMGLTYILLLGVVGGDGSYLHARSLALVVLLCRELEREAEVEKAKEGIVTCVQ